MLLYFFTLQLLGYRIFRWLFNFTISWLFNFTKFWWYKVTYYRQDDARRSEQYLGASAAQLLQHLQRLRLEDRGRPAIQQAAAAPLKSAPQDVLATYGIARQCISAYGVCRNFVTRKRYEGIRLAGRCSDAAPRLLRGCSNVPLIRG